MSTTIFPTVQMKMTLRSMSITTLMAMTLLAGQNVSALAQSTGPVPNGAEPQTKIEGQQVRAAAAPTKTESIEDRIAKLHESLKITAAQETHWKAVADVMRANAAAMDKLVADKAAKDPQSLTAVDDLKNYELFAQAHVTGLKKLISVFDTLYAAMPPAQKTIADQVFENARREPVASRG